MAMGWLVAAFLITLLLVVAVASMLATSRTMKRPAPVSSVIVGDLTLIRSSLRRLESASKVPPGTGFWS